MNGDNLPGAAKVNRFMSRLIVGMGTLFVLAGLCLVSVRWRVQAARSEYTSVPLVLQSETAIDAELETAAILPLGLAVEVPGTMAATNRSLKAIQPGSVGPFDLEWVVWKGTQAVARGRSGGRIVSDYRREGQHGWVMGLIDLPKPGRYRLDATLRVVGDQWSATPLLFVIEAAKSIHTDAARGASRAFFLGPLLLFIGGMLWLIRLALS
jgi:hypothetical protein